MLTSKLAVANAKRIGTILDRLLHLLRLLHLMQLPIIDKQRAVLRQKVRSSVVEADSLIPIVKVAHSTINRAFLIVPSTKTTRDFINCGKL
jgi:hypothetical protein